MGGEWIIAQFSSVASEWVGGEHSSPVWQVSGWVGSMSGKEGCVAGGDLCGTKLP